MFRSCRIALHGWLTGLALLCCAVPAAGAEPGSTASAPLPPLPADVAPPPDLPPPPSDLPPGPGDAPVAVSLPAGATGTVAAVTAVPVRDPFWPIGYTGAKPRTEAKSGTAIAVVRPQADPEDWDGARKLLSYRGSIRVGTTRLANINGKPVSPGETVSVVHEGLRYTWRLSSLANDQPVYERGKAVRVSP